MNVRDEDRTDLAAQGFLRLLQDFRLVILQDSVILRALLPDHPLWNHELFVREDYQQFAQEVQASLSTAEEPEELQIRRTMPAIATRLINLERNLLQSINHWGSINHRINQSIEQRLENFLTGRTSFTIRTNETSTYDVNVANAASSSSAAPSAAFGDASASAAAASVAVSTAASAVPVAASAVSSDLFSAAPIASSSAQPESRPELMTIDLDLNAAPPLYKLCRTINTVSDLYREWTVGLRGGSAVQTLERVYGGRWRPEQAERMFFSRRKVIIDEIQRRQACISAQDPLRCVEELEQIRRNGRMSLHALFKHLNKQRRIENVE